MFRSTKGHIKAEALLAQKLNQYLKTTLTTIQEETAST